MISDKTQLDAKLLDEKCRCCRIRWSFYYMIWPGIGNILFPVPTQYRHLRLAFLKKPVHGPKCTVFEWSPKSLDFTIWIPDTISKLFKATLSVLNIDQHSDALKCSLYLNIGIFNHYITFNHLNTRLFQYSDPHCTLKIKVHKIYWSTSYTIPFFADTWSWSFWIGWPWRRTRAPCASTLRPASCSNPACTKDSARPVPCNYKLVPCAELSYRPSKNCERRNLWTYCCWCGQGSCHRYLFFRWRHIIFMSNRKHRPWGE